MKPSRPLVFRKKVLIDSLVQSEARQDVVDFEKFKRLAKDKNEIRTACKQAIKK